VTWPGAILLPLAAILVAGCSLLRAGLGLGPSAPPPAAAPAAVPAPANATPSVLVAAHVRRAQVFEQEGDFRRALDEWKIALTVEPGSETLQARRRALEARIAARVAERLAQGRDALTGGAHLEARRHFLAVLALDPLNQPALDALRSEVREVRVLLHTVRRGETLAELSERYYGDRTRGQVIEDTNRLRGAAHLQMGTRLRIPEIPGVPFLAPDSRARPSPLETPEVNPLVFEIREALDRGEWVQALADTERLLAGSPQQLEGVELKKAALYGLGKSQLGERRTAEAYQTLTQLARLSPGYRDSAALLTQARDRLVQQHYSEGLRLYRDERLAEAIAEWRAALELDPDHANARRNLEQAQRVLQGLQQRRRAPGSGG
jgi:tetratricopeptide (TPR) repeat protein